jgi:hypothetical protein
MERKKKQKNPFGAISMNDLLMPIMLLRINLRLTSCLPIWAISPIISFQYQYISNLKPQISTSPSPLPKPKCHPPYNQTITPATHPTTTTNIPPPIPNFLPPFTITVKGTAPPLAALSPPVTVGVITAMELIVLSL